MDAFTRGEIDVLVSTTVIEVGVDVANATTMVIVDADRFGVSQLHQLRGRVGRGGLPGRCFLRTSAGESSPSMERLRAVAASNDGFELARIDLMTRREGDVLGAVQSGVASSLRFLSLVDDADVIDDARGLAAEVVLDDLTLADHRRSPISSTPSWDRRGSRTWTSPDGPPARRVRPLTARAWVASSSVRRSRSPSPCRRCAPPGAGPRVDARPAVAALAALTTVPARTHRDDYDRTAFGPAWTTVRTRRSRATAATTRDDILDRDLRDTTHVATTACARAVASGEMRSPYTGDRVDFRRGRERGGTVQIDHIVPLALPGRRGPRVGTRCG